MTMTEQAKAARREYMRKWRQEHKDNIRAANMRYWKKLALAAMAAEDSQNEPERPQEGGGDDS